MARLTGFEAVNASLYDRSTSIFEGICAAIRMGRGKSVAIIPETLYPGDLEVLETLAEGTEVELIRVPVDAATGLIDQVALQAATQAAGTRLAAIVFPHVNTFGLIEGVDALTDLAGELKVKSIAVIDPMLLGPGGLKARVGRHIRSEKKTRWHIDYLLPHTTLKKVWYQPQLRLECTWSETIAVVDAANPITG
jgi:glycine dehydrogenase